MRLTGLLAQLEDFKNTFDPNEFQQMVIRIISGISFWSILVLYTHFDPNYDLYNPHVAITLFCFTGASIALFCLVAANALKPVASKVLGAWIDMLVTTALTFYSHALAPVLPFVYFWLIFGHGFRFGRAYLWHAQVISIAGFLLSTANNEYWRQADEVRFALMLICLPLYIGTRAKKVSEERQKAIEANAAKSHFLATMSHEIRTPLNSIIGASELLRTTKVTMEQRNLLNTLDSTSKSLLNLLNNILDFSRIESNKLDSKPTDFELNKMVFDVLDMFRVQSAEKGVALTKVMPSGKIYVKGHENLIHQTLVNLVGNAMKFTQKGSVTLSIREMTQDETHIGFRFTVNDTGPGIPEKIQSEIFERFKRGENFSGTHSAGSGLGLAICKSLVESMGGSISVSSQEGLGSQFWFDLNLERSDAGADYRYLMHELVQNKNMKVLRLGILLCEDDSTNQVIMKRLLENYGHRVHAVNDSKEMLEELEATQYDLVICDYNIPIRNGIDTLKYYKASHPEDHSTRFIMLTADARPEVSEAAILAGYDDFINKPISSTLLTNRIADLFQETINLTLRNGISDPEAIEATEEQKLSLDEVTLKELETICDHDFHLLKMLLRNFLRDAEKLINQIEVSVKIYDVTQLRQHCHALKGSSLIIGAKTLANVSARLESMSEDDVQMRGIALSDRLKSELKKVSESVDTYLERSISILVNSEI